MIDMSSSSVGSVETRRLNASNELILTPLPLRFAGERAYGGGMLVSSSSNLFAIAGGSRFRHGKNSSGPGPNEKSECLVASYFDF
jgi:hypothetical protein